MEKLEAIQNELKQILSEKRYLHSVGAMKKAEELAKIYGIDIEKAKLAALTHDIAKEMPKEEMLAYVQQNSIPINEIEQEQLGLLHGKIGADIVKKKYGFSEDMQKAIEYHTTGSIQMDTLAKIVFIADKTEETRDYDNVEEVRELACQNLERCMLYLLNDVIKKNVKKEKLIALESIELRNQILIKLANAEKI
ncbi:MAG: bis(5'-nucleosyl)-tetraphosphatase (symmetrical) YqeK [Clostridia bacterium]|nr:bis(5'-nucleosyl)-tetraphosphatase (symmetrical) YqeK [Clostridia bacterium]